MLESNCGVGKKRKHPAAACKETSHRGDASSTDASQVEVDTDVLTCSLSAAPESDNTSSQMSTHSSESSNEHPPASNCGSRGPTTAESSTTQRAPVCGDTNAASLERPSYEERANCVQQWTLSYLTPLLKLGARKVLDVNDVGAPSAQDRAATAYDLVHKAWAHELKGPPVKAEERCCSANEPMSFWNRASMGRGGPTSDKNRHPDSVTPSLSLALLRAFGRRKVAFAMILCIVSSLLSFIPILILNDLVKFFEAGGSTDLYSGWAHPWVEVVGLGVIPAISALLQARHQVIMQHFAVFVRTACSTLLYEKSLKISPTGKATTGTGQVVNMMSNDTNQIMRFLQFVGMTLVAPVQLVLSLVLIFQQVGTAMWVGVGYMVFLSPLSIYIFSVVSRLRRQVLKQSDVRSKQQGAAEIVFNRKGEGRLFCFPAVLTKVLLFGLSGKKTMTKKSRVKMVNDILFGIRILKYFAWEGPFAKELERIREEELRSLTKLAFTTQVGLSLILMSAPLVQIILVFVTYTHLQNDPLNASVAFTTVALFNLMRFPFAVLPMGFLQFIQSRIAMRRIALYLALPDLMNYVSTPPHTGGEYADGGAASCVDSITMTDCSFRWINPDPSGFGFEREGGQEKRRSASQSILRKVVRSRRGSREMFDAEAASAPANDVILRSISCRIKAGSLVAIVGKVGSGKSSLLAAILGEMEAIGDSRVFLSQEQKLKAYCSQTPWVMNDTMRGNILFGRPFEQERYRDVIKACALIDDIALLPAGDLTEIGERGINLSGGQKARVCLARALYSKKTKLLLADDPLSSVDASVGEHLFNEAMAGKLSSSDCTIILVTHHVQFLPRCDSIIVMEEGRIKHQGTYAELVACGVDLSGAASLPESVATRKQFSLAANKETEANLVQDGDKTPPCTRDKKNVDAQNVRGEFGIKDDGKNNTLMTEEQKEEGSVSRDVLFHYAKAGGLALAALFLVAHGSSRGLEIGSSFWLAQWADQAAAAAQDGNQLSDNKTTFYLNIFALLGILSITMLAFKGIMNAFHRLKSSRKLHKDLVTSVLQAPVSFHEVTPIGRIVNRFSSDMDKIDLELTVSVSQAFNTLFNVLGSLCAISAATKGTFLVLFFPLGFAFYTAQQWFRKTSTELQRVFNMTRSPIFADFSQTLSGTSTIRAYGNEARFFAKCLSDFDRNNAAYMLVQLCSQWLSLRLDVFGGLVAAFIGGLAVGTASSNFIPAGWLGLSLVYSIEMTQYLKYGARMIATVEADFSSVERVLDYTNNIPRESPALIPSQDPPEGAWPVVGKIDAGNVCMRYQDGPLVLKKLSFIIEGGKKVGVVGRTGSGKSSLMAALLRIVELASGTIVIDGVETSSIGTRVLRTNVSIVPQEPFLFANTVRYNLDPFGDASESELWEALEKTQLSEVVAHLPKGLDEVISEGGENFSQGQRQMLCIARAVLRKAKVLIMDEATASIDNETDALLQRMIREVFSDATMLTIAHRMNTVMDSDLILVLDDGKVAEFDTPSALLSKTGGLFRELVEKSGMDHRPQ